MCRSSKARLLQLNRETRLRRSLNSFPFTEAPHTDAPHSFYHRVPGKLRAAAAAQRGPSAAAVPAAGTREQRTDAPLPTARGRGTTTRRAARARGCRRPERQRDSRGAKAALSHPTVCRLQKRREIAFPTPPPRFETTAHAARTRFRTDPAAEPLPPPRTSGSAASLRTCPAGR